MTAVGDAVANGIVSSLARQGGNITGTTYFVPELSVKRLELIKEALPRITQVAVLLNANNPSVGMVSKATGIAANSLKLSLQQFPVRAPSEFENAFAAIARKRLGAVVIYEDPLLIGDPKPIADLAVKHRLFAVGVKQFAEDGGAIGYGVDNLDMFHRTGYFVDKILKGARPADLPVEQPTKFELVLNLKAMKALGIKISDSILVRATKVIE
jgi:putative ABC transport system substrate-binding protein